MRALALLICGAALAACTPTLPNSGTRADNYQDFLDHGDAAVAGTTTRPGGTEVAGLDDPLGVGQGVRPRGDAPAGIAAQSGELALNNPARISDEQNFEAVAARETIESDRERLERLRAQYQVIAPTALPRRTGDIGPNIVQYALNTPNRLGVTAYRRLSPMRWTTSERNCAAFASADLAQIEFLRRGGPERDPRSLDPDGDGFACTWDPAPFRAAVRR